MTASRRPDPLALAVLLPIVAGACVVRLWGSFGEPLWLDEAYSAYAAGKGWAFLWQVVPRYETHPPFYYSLLRLWTLPFGDSLAALRALGHVCALATLPVLWWGGTALSRLTGTDRRGVAIAAVLLGAFAPPLVEMAREVRPYPVLILAYAGAIACLLRSAAGVAEARQLPRGAWAGYAASLAAVLWLHNLGPLYAAALGLAAVVLVARAGLARREWAWFLGGHFAAAIVYLPALAILIDQAPTWIRSTWLTFSWTGMEWRLPYLWGAPEAIARWAAAALVLLALAAAARRGEGRRAAAALVLLAGLPVALSLAVSVWVAPVFILRTMTPVAVPATLLLALGLGGQAGRLRLVALVAGLMLVGQTIVRDVNERRGGPMQDWYRAVRWLDTRMQPGDAVWAYPNEGALPLAYAARDLGAALRIVAVPTAVPSIGVGGWYPTGSRGVVSLPPARLRRIADAPGARAVPTIWLLRLGPWAYDKGDAFQHVLERDRRIVGRYRDGAIDLIGLRNREETPR